MEIVGNLRSWLAFAAAAMLFGASATPAKTAVFAGDGPRGRGYISWLQLVKSSPELDLVPVDAGMIRAGALDSVDVLVIPGGSSIVEKKDLGPEGAARIRDFVRRGGGYIGTCAGCCLALDERDTPERGIGLIPYRRTGSKDGFMMPIRLNGKGAAAMGMDAGEYVVSYHGGPVLAPSTNSVPDANVEVWATYASDFDCPKSSLRMFDKIALVGGTYGKGRLFAIACHPEANVFSHGLLKGAFRFVLGREVTFPTRIRRPRSLSVGAFTTAIGGLESAQALLDIDACEDVDFFPLTPDDIRASQLDRVDYLVFPAGYEPFYKTKFTGQTRELVEKFISAGGKALAWGNAAAFAPSGTRVFASAGECVDFIRREGAEQQYAIDFRGLFPPDVKTIGIVSVSSLIPTNVFVRGTNLLAEAGYRVKAMPNVLKKEPPKVRAKLFEQAWMDPEIDFLLFSRGGQGADDVIPCIDWDRLRGRSMRVQGFSDVTIVLGAMLSKGAGVPISGPSLSTLSTYNSKETREHMSQMLGGTPPPLQLTPVKPCSSAVSGTSFAGLLPRFKVLANMGYLPSFDGRIVFIESLPGNAKAAEPMLDDLVAKGAFGKAAAVVFCDFNNKWDKAKVDALFARFASKVSCPVFSGYPYGHVPRSFAIDCSRPLRISETGLLEWQPRAGGGDVAQAATFAAAVGSRSENHADGIVARVLENVAKIKAACPQAVPMAFWDFDGTILRGDISEGVETVNGRYVKLYKGLVERTIEAGLNSVYPAKGGWEQYWERDYRRLNEIGRWIAWPFNAQMYLGQSAAELDAFCAAECEKVYRKWYFASSMKMWRALEKAGVENYVVSASPEIFVRNTAKSLGVPSWRCRGIRVEMDGDRVTAKVVNPIPNGEGKVENVRELLLARPNGVAVAAFGNSYSTDAAFLRYVATQPSLPGGAKGTAVMINGGKTVPGYTEHFITVTQSEIEGDTGRTVDIEGPGGRAVIDLQGGRILSWKTSAGDELLFMPARTESADGDWSHGGISLCWPWFGKKGDKASSIHGFARNRRFVVRRRDASGTGCRSVTLGLSLAAGENPDFPYAADLELTLRMTDRLEMVMTTKNTGDRPFSLTCGIQPYFAVSGYASVTLRGVKEDSFAAVNGMDAAFPRRGDGFDLLDAGAGRELRMHASGNTGVVVWSPGSVEPHNRNLAAGDTERFIGLGPSCRTKEGALTIAPGQSHDLVFRIRAAP